MTSRSPTFFVIAVAIVAFVATPFLALARPITTVGGQAALAAGFTALAAAVALVAWGRYRSSADPHAMFSALGFSVLGLQSVALIAWSLRGRFLASGVPHSGVFETGTMWWSIGWLFAAASFALGVLPRGRAGGPAPRPHVAFASALGALALADVAILLLRPTMGLLRTLEAISPGTAALGLAGPVESAIAIATGAVLLAVAWHEARAAAGGRAERAWFAAACIAAVPAQIAVPVHPVEGFPVVLLTDFVVLLTPAAALAGFLSEAKIETSRLRRAADLAEEVMGGRAEIASMVSHEIRGPVATIRGLAQTSSRHFDRLQDEERIEFLRLIEDESARLIRVADEVSLALKIDAGSIAYSFEPEDLSEVVREGIDLVDTGGHPLSLELQPDVRAMLDRARFAEAIRELVENAATYSPPGSSIGVRARRDGGSIVVEVEDGGPGIPPDRREEAFAKFPRFRPAGYEEAPGAGLGLFICRAHVRRHGGDVVAIDGPGGGTMLRITLPDQGE